MRGTYRRTETHFEVWPGLGELMRGVKGTRQWIRRDTDVYVEGTRQGVASIRLVGTNTILYTMVEWLEKYTRRG